MVTVRTLTRAAVIALFAAGATAWYACSDRPADSFTGPAASPSPAPSAPRPGGGPDLRLAVAALRRHADGLLQITGVVGTAVVVLPDGRVGLQVLLEREGVFGLPRAVDGIPVGQKVTGRLMAFSDPTKRQRPAPLGFSVGHPAITAGTIGARVRDATGRVYILSNNHVLANSNGATIGDPTYQPGPFDGGTAADQIATLADFQTITFTSTANNTIDAAISLTTTAVLDNATPSDAGYGLPNSTIYGDANGDGLFDDSNALLGLNVQKYGRTTHLTHGQISGVHATVQICYEASGFSCIKSARYVDQLIISPGGFSGGGDSGSLIVTDDGNVNPVALLFAGSSTVTIGNRIDLVLNRFGVSIDGLDPLPPGPFTDVAVTGIGAPASVVQDATATVTVTLKNRGNQDVAAFDVTVQDATDGVTVGTQSVTTLTVGASATVTFNWTPHTLGPHMLVGSHALADDRPGNNQDSTTVTVNPPVTDVALTSVSAPGSVIQGHSTNVAVTVGNVGNQAVGTTFLVSLEDSTAGVSLGSQTVAGLAVGAKATLTFTLNATDAALGSHTLVATHSLTDDDAANNRRSVVVAVNPKPIDLALTAITGPRSVTQGDTAHIGVTVRNTGEQDVTASFDIVLTDGNTGATVASQTVAGLALGASATLDLPWNTAGTAVTGHTLFARQMLADANGSNNAIGIGISVTAPVAADVAITAVSVPGSVSQGQAINVGVTVTNSGSQAAGTFVLTLQDSTAGVTIGSQTVTGGGLAVGATATLTFSWSTIGAALGSHTLVATHNLTDANAANNRRTAAVTVNPTVVDVAVASISAPAAVTQGNAATIGVTVQNVGGEPVNTSFDVVLTDATAGVTIGTQTLTGLAAASSASLSFSWNTTGAAPGSHTLVASHTLADASSGNNTQSAAVTVNAKLTDIALTSIAGPASVTQGDTAHVGVAIQNVGSADVGTSFSVVVTDATAGGTVGTQMVAGLAAGAVATLDFPWNTAGVAISGHTLIAQQQLADNNSSNNARAIGISVIAPSVHVGDLTGSAVVGVDTWSATVEVVVHDYRHNLINDATVQGSWGGPTGQCTTGETGSTGTCRIVLSSIPLTTRLVSLAINSVTRAGFVFRQAANHDPDGSSNGTTIFVRKP
jgi:hypothetical protein